MTADNRDNHVYQLNVKFDIKNQTKSDGSSRGHKQKGKNIQENHSRKFRFKKKNSTKKQQNFISISKSHDFSAHSSAFPYYRANITEKKSPQKTRHFHFHLILHAKL